VGQLDTSTILNAKFGLDYATMPNLPLGYLKTKILVFIIG